LITLAATMPWAAPARLVRPVSRSSPAAEYESPGPNSVLSALFSWWGVSEAAVPDGGALAVLELAGAVLDGAVLDGAVLDGAVLDGAVLDGAVLDGAVLDGAVLDGAVLDGAVLDRAVLDRAVLVVTVPDLLAVGPDAPLTATCRWPSEGERNVLNAIISDTAASSSSVTVSRRARVLDIVIVSIIREVTAIIRQVDVSTVVARPTGHCQPCRQ